MTKTVKENKRGARGSTEEESSIGVSGLKLNPSKTKALWEFEKLQG